MGNKQTVLKKELKEAFRKEEPKNDFEVIVKIDSYYLTFYMFQSNSGLNYTNEKKKADIIFCPETHMRDFEVLIDKNGKEDKIARGQGIGVIVIPCLNNTYCKLMYESEDDSKVVVVEFASGTHEELQNKLSEDLGLGYSVLFVYSDKSCKQLTEEKNEQDSKETVILFDHLKKMKSFSLKKSKTETQTCSDSTKEC